MKMVKVLCEWCGKQILKPRKEFNRSVKLGRKFFCSRSEECKKRKKNTAQRGRNMAGEKNPNWKGGISASQSVMNSRRKHPERNRARRAVSSAIKRGMLTRPKHCNDCGLESYCEAHHESYDKPLNVMWLCRKCHEQRDAQLKAQGRL